MLSPEERDALARKAGNLRTVISDLTAERDAARASNAMSADDARLIAEVRGLETKYEQAKAERDEAVSAKDAIELMRAAMLQEASAAVAAAEAAGAEFARSKADADEAGAPVAAAEAAASSKTQKGGSR